jgi:putative Holliday junction resolvase
MSLDVGDRSIGIAYSDLLNFTAQGLKTLRRGSKDDDLAALRAIVDEFNVGTLVIGLPKNMDGTLSKQGRKTQSFGQFLKKRLDVEVIYEDERLTTVMSEKMLIDKDMSRSKRKKIIDTVAAQIILQGYLDRQAAENKIKE